MLESCETTDTKPMFEAKSLFLKEVSYRLSDLQKYLTDNGYSLSMLNKVLNYENKVNIFEDNKGDIQVTGVLSKEYLAIRKLVYDHFAKV